MSDSLNTRQLRAEHLRLAAVADKERGRHQELVWLKPGRKALKASLSQTIAAERAAADAFHAWQRAARGES